MNSIPKLNNELLNNLFSQIESLFNRDKKTLLLAAQQVTAGELRPFELLPGEDFDKQIKGLKKRIARRADNYGQSLLVRLIEKLYDNLIEEGAIGVSDQEFINSTCIKINNHSFLKYSEAKKWIWGAEISTEGNAGLIELSIRCKDLDSDQIVKDYTLQFVEQGVVAYENNRPAVALSLISIALESTLRDALTSKGITYTFGVPTQDVYDLTDIHIHRLNDGYKVSFPQSMPLDFTQFLIKSNSPPHLTARIKRVIKNQRKILEIRDVDELLDFWSSNSILQAGQTKIGGLGQAIRVSRKENILNTLDLPPDLDGVILALRNNLIHLSNDAMAQEVMKTYSGESVSLREFLSDKNKVFDAILALGETINTIYEKIAENRL